MRSLTLSLLLPLLAACGPEPDPNVPLEIALQFQTPTPGWSLELQNAYFVDDELWCIHQLTSPDGMVAQVISDVVGKATLTLPASRATPPPAIRHYVLGKTWNWNPDETLVFLDSLDAIAGTLERAVPIPLGPPAE